MPTRYLKPGIRDSESIDKLSPLAENLYVRLIATVDDFGRFDARPSMIKAQCFPIKDSVNAKRCLELLHELSACKLIVLYRADDKDYLQMCKWENTPRSHVSKFPTPAEACIHAYTLVKQSFTVLPVFGTVTVTVTDHPDGFDEFWKAYPKKAGKPAAARAWKAARINGELSLVLADVANRTAGSDWQKEGGKYIPHPTTYLNQRRWEDEAQQSIDPFAGAI